MAQLPGSTDTADIVGLAEDVHDAIYDISTRDTPFIRLVGSDQDIMQTFHEWQIDALRAPAENKKPEGNVYTFTAVDPTVQVGNYTQISDETFSITGTAEAVKMYGRGRSRGGEVARQRKKKSAELMLDVERQLIGVQDASDDTAGIRTTASFGTWLESNTSRGAGGADGGWNNTTKIVDAPTPGTDRAFVESQVQDVLESAYAAGGEPSFIMMHHTLKRKFSAFAGLAETRQNQTIRARTEQQRTIIAASDFYVGDFGTLAATPNKHADAGAAFCIDPAHAAVGYLRRLDVMSLAKTADSEDFGIVTEFVMVVHNEAAHGIIDDLDATL